MCRYCLFPGRDLLFWCTLGHDTKNIDEISKGKWVIPWNVAMVFELSTRTFIETRV